MQQSGIIPGEHGIVQTLQSEGEDRDLGQEQKLEDDY